MGRASALSQSIDPTSSTLRVQQSANRNILMFNSLEKRHDSLNPILSFVLLRNAFLQISEYILNLSIFPLFTLTPPIFTIYEQMDFQGLAGWLGWLEHHPVHQKAAGLIPGWGTYIGTQVEGSTPGWHAFGEQPIDASLPHGCLSHVSLSLLLLL